MTKRIQVQLTRHYVGALTAAWTLTIVALPLKAPALALLGLLLGLTVLLGARAPGRPRLTAQARTSIPTPAEEARVDVTLTIENKGHRAIFGEWRLELPGPSSVAEGTNVGYQYLHRHQRQEIPLALRFHLFGLQRLGPLQVRLEDPFGYTVLEGAIGKHHPVRVTPRVEPLRDTVFRARQKRTIQGAYEVSQPGTGFEFFGLRGYVPGDRPRDVNWKASARSGSYIVNQHQKETDAEVVLLVDTRAATGYGRRTMTPFAQACRTAISVADAHLMARDAVRVVAYGDGIHEDRHTGAVRRMQGVIDLIVDLEPAGQTQLAEVVRKILPSLRPRSPVMLFSALVDDPTVPATVADLLARDHPVQAIVPTPDWGDDETRPDSAVAWEARQQAALARLRRTGIPVATHAPGDLLEQSVLGLEVVA